MAPWSLGSSISTASESGILPICATRFKRPSSSDCRVVSNRWFEKRKHCLTVSLSLAALPPKVALNLLRAPRGLSTSWMSVPETSQCVRQLESDLCKSIRSLYNYYQHRSHEEIKSSEKITLGKNNFVFLSVRVSLK